MDLTGRLFAECQNRNLHASITYQRINDFSIEIYTGYVSNYVKLFYTDGHTDLNAAIKAALGFLKVKYDDCYTRTFLAFERNEKNNDVTVKFARNQRAVDDIARCLSANVNLKPIFENALIVANREYHYGFIGQETVTNFFTAGVGKVCGRIIDGGYCSGTLYGYKTIKKRRVQETYRRQTVRHGKHGIPLYQYAIKTVQLLKCDCCGLIVAL